jgi:hypothetical protein
MRHGGDIGRFGAGEDNARANRLPWTGRVQAYVATLFLTPGGAAGFTDDMWSTAPPPVTLVEHFAVIVGNLLWALGWKHRPGLNKVFLGVIEWRIRRLKGQIETLLAKAEAGTLRSRSPADPGKPRKPRVLRPVSEKPAPTVHPFAKDWPLPRKFGWLIPLVPAWAPGAAGHLTIQLKDPKLASLVFAHPVLAARFRPLCWMLGVDRDLLPPTRARARTVEEASASVTQDDPNQSPPPLCPPREVGACAGQAGEDRPAPASRPRRGRRRMLRLRIGGSISPA